MFINLFYNVFFLFCMGILSIVTFSVQQTACKQFICIEYTYKINKL